MFEYEAAMRRAGKVGMFERHTARFPLCRYYAWAIPNEEAIRALVKMSPLVEVGAGMGYWAKLIREHGGDIIAYDHRPTRAESRYHRPPSPEEEGECNFLPKQWPEESWSEVLRGTPEDLKKHRDRTLFLCWPPYNDPMGAACLMHYRGNTLALISEGLGGCCGGGDMWWILEREWDRVEGSDVYIPTWDGMHDYLRVYTRSTAPREDEEDDW